MILIVIIVYVVNVTFSIYTQKLIVARAVYKITKQNVTCKFKFCFLLFETYVLLTAKIDFQDIRK